MTRYLPDTNVISHLMRGDVRVHARMEDAHADGAEIVLSPMVVFEIQRGLILKRATTQRRNFKRLVAKLRYTEFDLRVWDRASEFWAHSRRVGMPLQDADILIAAQAYEVQAVMVTNNERHFAPFVAMGLQIEDWTK